MAPMRLLISLAAVYAAPWLSSRHYLLARAEAQDAEGDEKESAGGVEGGEGGEGGEGEGEGEKQTVSEEDVEAFANSAKDLKGKLAQLRELLNNREGKLDDDLKAKLASLEESLGGLGLDDGDAASELVNACVSMSMSRNGVNRPSTVGALRKISMEGTTLEDVKEMQLMRMIAVCLNDLTEEQLKGHLGGSAPALPKAMAEKASQPEADELVIGLEQALFGEVQTLAKGMMTQLKAEGATGNPPGWYAALGGLLMIAAVGFLAKKFLDMQKEQAAKKDKPKKKNK